MSSRRSSNKENINNLSSFGERLKRLSDTFYSTILQEEKEEKVQIKNAQQLEDLQYNDFTFDECSTSQITSNDHFNFTFHSIDQTNSQISHKSKTRPTNHSSTPYSIPRENLIKKVEDDTIVVEENPSLPPLQPIIVGYYPVISYQPISLPPTFYYSKEEIQSERNDYTTLTKITPIKKK